MHRVRTASAPRLALLATACVGMWAWSASAQDTINLECPCRLMSSPTGATATLGVRNFRPNDSGDLRVEVRAYQESLWSYHAIAVAPLSSVGANSTLEARDYAVAFDVPEGLGDERNLALVLQEDQGGVWAEQDHVRMAVPVDLVALDFDIGDLDYLADSDGDGVGDINERLAGTDPGDADSTPGDVEVDVLAIHNRGFAQLYEGDPYTRIRHVMMVANEAFRDSQTGIRLRLVGFAEAEVEDDNDEGSSVDRELAEQLAQEHGADIMVMFRPLAAGGGTCGWAALGGYGGRGHIALEEYRATYATVFGGCGGSTTAHEIGHLMGLGHSYRQLAEGTFRWSRGHYVDDDDNRGTVMSYGGAFHDVFSDPGRDCDGLPCGKEIGEPDGAHAVASLNAVRFQIAMFAPGKPDADEDGVVDSKDAFPDDEDEWRDTDGDGIGNTADADDDGDGVADGIDVFPLDPTESADRDGDGFGDNGDAFPDDPDESSDTDGDGIGDNGDAFPTDPGESSDTDGDGVGDNGDAFPTDPSESSDTDGDGVGDNGDADADGDGVANASDVFPLDPGKSDLASYLIRGEQAGDRAGEVVVAAGDVDGDGVADFAIGAPYYSNRRQRVGAVYLISGADLPGADAADGRTDRVISLGHVKSQPGSYKFTGEVAYERAGAAIAIGDWSGDGRADLVIGAPGRHGPDQQWWAGAAYLVDGSSLASLDAADGAARGAVELENVAETVGSWVLSGTAGAAAGGSVAIAKQLDDSGRQHVVVGANGDDGGRGATYIVSTVQLESTDAVDGVRDGIVQLAEAVAQAGSWKLRGEGDNDRAGRDVAAGDLDGDGGDEVVVRSPGHGGWLGATYVVAGEQLPRADAADGEADGIVGLARAADGSRSWKLTEDGYYGTPNAAIAHLDDDGFPVLLLSTTYHPSYVVSSADLPLADAADGTGDGVVQLDVVSAQPGSLSIYGLLSAVGDVDGDGANEIAVSSTGERNRRGNAYLVAGRDLLAAASNAVDGWIDLGEIGRELVGARSFQRFGSIPAAAGDVDGDGLADLLFGAPGDGESAGEIFLLLAADLAALDAVDGDADRRALLSNLAGDTDGDGLRNSVDPDDDNDGRPDGRDAFPLDATEWTDRDRDGSGDNHDAFPDDAAEQTDTDGDGIGDHADTDDDGDGIADDEDERPLDTDNDGIDNDADADDDNDGVADANDDLPFDASETTDTDGDGIGDNADADDDNDGVADANDDLPFDASETTDTDGDGVGDNADAFPNDPDESADFDGDGIGDNADADDDNDGVDDADDAFPLDASESADADGDGIGDNADAFPNDPDESADFDGDGTGDNADADDDNDGVRDVVDLFPHMAAKSTLTSYKLVGEAEGDGAGYDVSSIRNRGLMQLVVGAPSHDGRGALYVIAVREMRTADALDGDVDRRIDLGNVATLSGSRKILGADETQERFGSSVTSTGEIDDNGLDIVVGAPALVGAVYAVSTNLETADDADGFVDGVINIRHATAWRFAGSWGDDVGASVAELADVDGDGMADLILGRPGGGIGSAPGQATVVSAKDLQRHGSTIELWDHGTWTLVGEDGRDRAGSSVSAGDIDGDGIADLLIGAPGHSAVQVDEGALYLLPSAALEAADLADASSDRTIELANVSGLPNGWKFVGEAGDGAGETASFVGDMDGDGIADILIGTAGNRRDKGAAYLVSTARLLAADQVDGNADGTIELGNVAALASCWKFLGKDFVGHVAPAGDVNADGVPDLLIRGARLVYLVSGAHLDAADLADGSADGLIELESVADQDDSWVFVAKRYVGDYPLFSRSAKGVGDLDGDGFADLAIGTQHNFGSDRGAAYFVSATDLPLLDQADGNQDGVVDLNSVKE